MVAEEAALSQPAEQRMAIKGWGYSSMVECLSNKSIALGSVLSSEGKKE